jgi:hypothetical protein
MLATRTWSLVPPGVNNGAISSAATISSTKARNGPDTGAVRSKEGLADIGSGFYNALRMVLDEWFSCSAISRMVRPS